MVAVVSPEVLVVFDALIAKPYPTPEYAAVARLRFARPLRVLVSLSKALGDLLVLSFHLNTIVSAVVVEGRNSPNLGQHFAVASFYFGFD